MLMRRATASVTFHAQYTLSWCIDPVFRWKFTLNVRRSLKSRTKLLKTPILWVQGRSRSSMLIPPESSSAVLVMICSKSVSIGNRYLARLVDSSRNRMVTKFDALRRTPWRQGVDTYTVKIYVWCWTFHVHVFLSPVISAPVHSWNVYMAASNRGKKSLNFGGSRSFKVIDVGTPGKHVSSACYDAQHVCVYLQTFSC